MFHPLGISEFKQDCTPKGIPKAGWGLHLKMEYIAKLGYLLLKKGKWEEAQIVPEEWVVKCSASMWPQTRITTMAIRFGYQRISERDAFCLLVVIPIKKIVAVLPELNLVVVYVGESYNTNDLLRDFIVPALKKKVCNIIRQESS